MNKFIVGITGGIGSGKSLISSIFTSLGIPVYDSDLHAKNLYDLSDIRELVIAALGEKSYIGNKLDKEYVKKLVFSDKTALSKLNAIIHPAVINHFKSWVDSKNSPIVFKEAAILIESGAHQTCNGILSVSANEQLRTQRVMERDGMTKAQVQARINRQLTDEERESYSDWVIINDGSTSVIKQVVSIYEELQSKII